MANTKKININIPEELLTKLDDEADLQHMTRTAYIIRAVAQMVEADTFLRMQPDIKRRMTELTEALSSVAAIADKDYAGLVGQQTIDMQQ